MHNSFPNPEDVVLPFFDNLDIVKTYFTTILYNEGLPVDNQLIGLVGYTPDTLPFISLFNEHGHRFHIFENNPYINSTTAIYEPYMKGLRFIIVKSERFHFSPSSEIVRLYTPPEKFTYDVANFVTTFRWVSMNDILANIRRNKCLARIPQFMKEVQETIADFMKPENIRRQFSCATGEERSDQVERMIENMSYGDGLDKRKQRFAIYGFTKDQLVCSYIFDVMGCQLIPVTKEQSTNKEYLFTNGFRLCIIDDPNVVPHFDTSFDVNFAYIHANEFDVQMASFIVGFRWMSIDEIVKNLIRNNRHDVLDGPNGLVAQIEELEKHINAHQ